MFYKLTPQQTCPVHTLIDHIPGLWCNIIRCRCWWWQAFHFYFGFSFDGCFKNTWQTLLWRRRRRRRRRRHGRRWRRTRWLRYHRHWTRWWWWCGRQRKWTRHNCRVLGHRWQGCSRHHLQNRTGILINNNQKQSNFYHPYFSQGWKFSQWGCWGSKTCINWLKVTSPSLSYSHIYNIHILEIFWFSFAIWCSSDICCQTFG